MDLSPRISAVSTSGSRYDQGTAHLVRHPWVYHIIHGVQVVFFVIMERAQGLVRITPSPAQAPLCMVWWSGGRGGLLLTVDVI